MVEILRLEQVCKYIQLKFDKDILIKNIYVKCKISQINEKYGNIYLRLYDNNTYISGIIFSNSYKYLYENINIGDEVIIYGSIDVYIAKGYYQFIIEDIEKCGISERQKQFEILKNKLLEKGFFDSNNKKSLPKFPSNISIVTSEKSAAFYDVLVTLQKRYPYLNVNFHYCSVQGSDAISNIIKKLYEADRMKNDLILLVRGGGEKSELDIFNSEEIANCIFNLKTPLVTGIGHEIDVTISDLVADKRSSTPTAAVLDSFPSKYEICDKLSVYKNFIIDKFSYDIKCYKKKISELSYQLKKNIDLNILNNKNKINNYKDILNFSSFDKNIKKGFGVIFKKNKLASINNIKNGDIIEVFSKNKKIICEVKEIIEDEFGKKYFKNRKDN